MEILIGLFLILAIAIDISETPQCATVLFVTGLIMGGVVIGDMVDKSSINKKSEKGYNVFPVYEVSGKDTINTTWYVREKH